MLLEAVGFDQSVDAPVLRNGVDGVVDGPPAVKPPNELFQGLVGASSTMSLANSLNPASRNNRNIPISMPPSAEAAFLDGNVQAGVCKGCSD
jgi:hypothetical protein